MGAAGSIQHVRWRERKKCRQAAGATGGVSVQVLVVDQSSKRRLPLTLGSMQGPMRRRCDVNQHVQRGAQNLKSTGGICTYTYALLDSPRYLENTYVYHKYALQHLRQQSCSAHHHNTISAATTTSNQTAPHSSYSPASKLGI